MNFDGTGYAFLESPVFLLVIAVLFVVGVVLERRLGAGADEGPVEAAVAGLGVGLGALLFAGTLADHGYPAWAGLLGGLACATFAHLAVRSVLRRTRARLDAEAQGALPVYAEGSAGLLAALSVALPPVSLLALGFFARLLTAGRRREGDKYAGLRILR